MKHNTVGAYLHRLEQIYELSPITEHIFILAPWASSKMDHFISNTSYMLMPLNG